MLRTFHEKLPATLSAQIKNYYCLAIALHGCYNASNLSMKGRSGKDEKKLAIFALLLAAVLLLAACAGKNNGEKKLTAGDIEGTWTVSGASVLSKGHLSLDGMILKPDSSAVLFFRGGKITWEWEAQDGKKTSEAGSYTVTDGDVFFSSVKLRAKLEGKTLTLTELAPPKGEGSYIYKEEDGAYHKADDPSVIEVPDK
ncbi:MAG: hypothetical protein IKI84_06190, partial [Clostridia bacterium]|nr:hypothetical protein [Clostridia bacterium]